MNEILAKLWYGEVPLKRAFWAYDFGGVAALQFFSMALSIWPEILEGASVLWALFMIKAVFTSATRYSGDPGHAFAARIGACLLAVGAVHSLFF